jgi:redox-sensing transcriptional repressor
MTEGEVSDLVIGRLPLYLRTLTLLDEAGQEFVSSIELGRKLGLGSAQIRKDLSHFGGFGKQGTGYEVKYLREEIAKILHVDRDWAVALAGFGDLGRAIVHYGGFATKWFHIEAIFDNDPVKIGQEFNGTIVQDIANLGRVIAEQQIRVIIITVPASAAQEIADQAIEAGVRAILNYAPITLKVPEEVHVQHIDLITHLQQITYYLPC